MPRATKMWQHYLTISPEGIALAVSSLIKDFETKSPVCKRRYSTEEVENHSNMRGLVWVEEAKCREMLANSNVSSDQAFVMAYASRNDMRESRTDSLTFRCQLFLSQGSTLRNISPCFPYPVSPYPLQKQVLSFKQSMWPPPVPHGDPGAWELLVFREQFRFAPYRRPLRQVSQQRRSY